MWSLTIAQSTPGMLYVHGLLETVMQELPSKYGHPEDLVCTF